MVTGRCSSVGHTKINDIKNNAYNNEKRTWTQTDGNYNNNNNMYMHLTEIIVGWNISTSLCKAIIMIAIKNNVLW